MGAGIALGVLIRLHTDFQVAPAHQGRHAHAVVVDEFQFVGAGHHDIGMLQVAVGDVGVFQFADQGHPALGHLGEGGGVAFEGPGADPFEQRLPFDPVHEDQGIPLAVAGAADAVVAIFEVDQAGNIACFQVGADLVVAFAPFGRLGGENANGKGAPVACGNPLVDDGEGARPRTRLISRVLGDAAFAQRRVPEGVPRVLQHGTEMGGERPGHGVVSSYGKECSEQELTERTEQRGSVLLTSNIVKFLTKSQGSSGTNLLLCQMLCLMERNQRRGTGTAESEVPVPLLWSRFFHRKVKPRVHLVLPNIPFESERIEETERSALLSSLTPVPVNFRWSVYCRTG